MRKLAYFVPDVHKFVYFFKFHLNRVEIIFRASDNSRRTGLGWYGELEKWASGEAARRTGWKWSGRAGHDLE